MQKVLLIGNLTKDPVLRNTNGGKEVANFSVAVNERRGENERTTFFDVAVFGAAAPPVAQYLHKGSRVYVEGSLAIQSWTDREGNTRLSPTVRSSSVQFLDRPAKAAEGNGKPPEAAADTLEDDDIPF